MTQEESNVVWKTVSLCPKCGSELAYGKGHIQAGELLHKVIVRACDTCYHSEAETI